MMKKEELLEKFHNVSLPFLLRINDKVTREAMMLAYRGMLAELQREAENNGGLFYTLIRGFVDQTNPEQHDRGETNILVELIDGRIIDIEDYCDLVTNKERYITLLRWGIENFNFNLYL